MLSHFALYALEGDYWPLPAERRSEFRKEFPTTLRAAAQALHVYQVFPTRAEADFLVWSTSEAGRPEDAAAFFRQYAGAVGRWRHLVRPTLVPTCISQRTHV
jgi:hypothetical protein